jgi:hypothetical protein
LSLKSIDPPSQRQPYQIHAGMQSIKQSISSYDISTMDGNNHTPTMQYQSNSAAMTKDNSKKSIVSKKKTPQSKAGIKNSSYLKILEEKDVIKSSKHIDALKIVLNQQMKDGRNYISIPSHSQIQASLKNSNKSTLGAKEADRPYELKTRQQTERNNRVTSESSESSRKPKKSTERK